MTTSRPRSASRSARTPTGYSTQTGRAGSRVARRRSAQPGGNRSPSRCRSSIPRRSRRSRPERSTRRAISTSTSRRSSSASERAVLAHRPLRSRHLPPLTNARCPRPRRRGRDAVSADRRHHANAASPTSIRNSPVLRGRPARSRLFAPVRPGAPGRTVSTPLFAEWSVNLNPTTR